MVADYQAQGIVSLLVIYMELIKKNREIYIEDKILKILQNNGKDVILGYK